MTELLENIRNNFMEGLLIGGLVVYFLPAIIAISRNKKNKVAIVVLNFFTGWTLIGWVVAMVWATMND